jgi:signal transduction histidine kinase
MLNRENAVVTGVYAAGTLTPANARELAGYVTTQRYLYEQAARYLTGDIADTYSAIHTSTAYGRLAAMEDQLSLRAAPNRNGIPTGINIEQWRADFNQIDQQLLDMESAAEALTLDQAKPFAYGIVAKAAIAGIVGLIVLVVLIVVSLRIARRIIRRIETLRADALHLAFDRLPDVVGRLRAGEEVDPAQVAPEPHTGDDELAQLTEAFGRVQTTAITSAVQEAALRNGLNKVFLNIARRSQTLLHRQLALLDGMERRTADPDDLEELFRIDHLATRMRRHAEDLVILAGSTPGRAWRNPVSVTDVLRAAASEVEQYQRVIVRPQPDLALSGRAVGDVVHLIAELLENATQYSPPDTEVTVTGQAVPNGLAIDIDDRGLGVTAAALDDINTRLADPPEFDPAASLRLGLYVVARLAHKHGIRVTLRQSAYGGITAVVLLPPDIVVAGHHAASYPAGRAGDARPTARALTAGPDVHPGDDEPTDPGIGPRSLVLVSGGLVSRGAANDAAPAPGPTAPGLAADGPTAPGLAADGPTAPGLTADGLPQRVRQSARPAGAAATMGGSTAPAGPAVTTLAPAAPAPARAAARSPQDMRRMLTSFQAGMRRGRIDATHEHIATPEHHEEGPPR